MDGLVVTGTPARPNTDANTGQVADIAQQGRLNNRTVSLQGSGSVALAPLRECVDNTTTMATPTGERTVGLVPPDDPAHLPISWFTEHLPVSTGLVGTPQDHFSLPFESQSLAGDMRNVVGFAQEIDQDILRASALLEKLERKPLNEKEQREVNTLLGAGKYNLAQVQRWTAVASHQCEGYPKTQEFITKLQQRLADRHMDLADLMCLYDLDQTPPEQAVSRADRIDHNLVAANAALKVAEGLSDSGSSKEAKEQLVEVLKAHRAELGQAKKDVAIGRGSDSAHVLSKAVWDIPLTKGKKAGDSIVSLHKHWDAKAAGATGNWLPLAHPKLTQGQMLQEFVGYQLKRAGVAKANMPDLKFAFKQATNRTMNERPWEPIEKQLHYSVGGELRTAHSNITPAKAMAGYFAEALPANGVNCGDRMQYTHVPNLAHTELTDESGNPLFSALRHGVLDAYDISASTLRKLPERELTTMVRDLLVSPEDEGAGEPWVNRVVGAICDAIRTNKSEASTYASKMRTAASANMAKELAVAALVSDPDKLEAALAGETVDISLSSISLLTPDRIRKVFSPKSDEREMLRRQTEALQNLGGGERSLQVRDASGQLRTVAVNCKVRTFNFGVNAGAVGTAKHIPSHTRGWDKLMGWGYAMERNNPELRTLLGDPNAETLGGDVADRLAGLRHAADIQQSELAVMRIAAPRHPEIAAKIPECEKDIVAANLNIAILREAATDAKQIWREGSYNKGGEDPYKMVSRLGMVIETMDETLAFNCKSGKDRTGQLDAELKYLMALGMESPLPEPGAPATPELRQMRSDFTLHSGNLEMQRMNTGLPGFKLNIKEVPGLANYIAGPGMEPMYRGGSDYIKS